MHNRHIFQRIMQCVYVHIVICNTGLLCNWL